MKKTISKEEYTYDNYIEDIKFYWATSPFENTFQRVVENVLKDTIRSTDIKLIISDRFPRCNTKSHCVSGYKENGTASPDLLLAKDFRYGNSKEKGKMDEELSEVEICVHVEVKMPEIIKFEKGKIKYTKHDKNQIETYLKHPRTCKIIFTDLYTWIFYEGCLKPKKVIKLREGEWNQESWIEFRRFLGEFVFGGKDK